MATYDMNTDYQAEINKEMAKTGVFRDWNKISQLQKARQAKINENQGMAQLWNLSDADIQNSLSALNQTNTQQENQPIPGYQDPYKSYIDTAITNIRNTPNFSYDMNQDQALQQAQDLTSKNVYETIQRQNARRGMQNDFWNQNQAGQASTEAALALIPQFRNQALQEYTTNYGKDVDILNALSGLKQQDIGNILDVAGLTGSLGGINTIAGRQQTQSEQAQKFEQQQFIDEKEWSRNANNPDNQLKQLEIAAQKIQLSELPEQVKLQTAQMVNDVATGKLEPNVVKAQIDQIYSGINVDKSNIAAQGIQNLLTGNQAFQTQANTEAIKQQTSSDYAKMKSIEGLSDEEYLIFKEILDKVKSGEMTLESLGL